MLDSENNDIRVTYVTLCAVLRVAKISLKRNVKYAEDEAEHILQETDSDCLLAHEECKKQ